jgi:dUTP pyrophosphatase
MKINIINQSKHPLPAYETAFSAGMDLRANIDLPIILDPLKRALVPTGLYMEITEGYEGQIRPRSGLANKHGISIVNSPGTIDADYRGEVKVLLVNLSDKPFVVRDGERIAQMVIAKHERVTWNEAKQLADTARGINGIGSTGVN